MKHFVLLASALPVLMTSAVAVTQENTVSEIQATESLIEAVTMAMVPASRYEKLTPEEKQKVRAIAKNAISMHVENVPASSAFMRPLNCEALVTSIVHQEVCEYSKRTGRKPYEFNGEIYYFGRPMF